MQEKKIVNKELKWKPFDNLESLTQTVKFMVKSVKTVHI